MAWSKVDTDEFRGGDRTSVRFFPPSRANARGWSEIITFLAPNLMVKHTHFIAPMPGLMYKDGDGNLKPRDRETAVTCLGSPRTPLGEEMPSPVYDPTGLVECQNVKLPNGMSLHDTPFNQAASMYPSKHPWQVFIPIYVHPNQKHPEGLFRILDDYISNTWVRSLIMEVQQHDDDVRSYSLQLQSIFAGDKRLTGISRVPTPTNPPIVVQNGMVALAQNATETQQADWARVQMWCKPYKTAEAMVQFLGIEQWNPQYAGAPPVQAPPPTSATPPASGGDNGWWSTNDPDPFGGGEAPVPGSVNRL
jgi:hypothetical protein